MSESLSTHEQTCQLYKAGFMSTPLPIVVLISGNGSNLQAIIEAIQQQVLPARICAVISNNPCATGLEYAHTAGIPTKIIHHKMFSDRREFDTALQNTIDQFTPQLVVLAGFMRILGPTFTAHYEGRMLNIHPSLLPAFTGLNTHQRALEAKVTEHGASVHFVTCELDGGPVIIQARVPIADNDSINTLAQRVLNAEHSIYPLAIRWFAEGRLRLIQGEVMLDGQLLTTPVNYQHESHRQLSAPL